jgi:hypothetical protein
MVAAIVICPLWGHTQGNITNNNKLTYILQVYIDETRKKFISRNIMMMMQRQLPPSHCHLFRDDTSLAPLVSPNCLLHVLLASLP